MKSDDLISRSALVEYFEGLARSLANARCFNAADAIQGAAEKIKAAPAVDAEPVRHGRWLETNKRFKGIYQCSVCGSYLTMTSGALADGRKDYYCPNCGAKMDGDKDAFD